MTKYPSSHIFTIEGEKFYALDNFSDCPPTRLHIIQSIARLEIENGITRKNLQTAMREMQDRTELIEKMCDFCENYLADLHMKADGKIPLIEDDKFKLKALTENVNKIRTFAKGNGEGQHEIMRRAEMLEGYETILRIAAVYTFTEKEPLGMDPGPLEVDRRIELFKKKADEIVRATYQSSMSTIFQLSQRLTGDLDEFLNQVKTHQKVRDYYNFRLTSQLAQ